MDSLFDYAEAEAAKIEAIDRVSANADPNWKFLAIQATRKVAMQRETFTSEHVWAELVAEGSTTHEPKAMGGILRKAAQEGICEVTERFIKSSSRINHRRPLQIWKSLIYPGRNP